MKVLDQKQIQQKIKRLAIEILENNYGEAELIFIGINNNGMVFARLLSKALKNLTDMEILVTRVRLNPAKPLGEPIELEMSKEKLAGKALILVDDVANTGRTIFYAMKPLMDILAKRIEIAVLVDRKHKSFPVKVDYVGLSLATTLKDNIEVSIAEKKDWAVSLE